MFSFDSLINFCHDLSANKKSILLVLRLGIAGCCSQNSHGTRVPCRALQGIFKRGKMCRFNFFGYQYDWVFIVSGV